jgi:uncharacterized membrane protein YbhN (UPF0104 family)
VPPERRFWMQGAGLCLGLGAGAWVLASLPIRDAPWRLSSVGPGLALALLPYPLTLAFDTLGWRTLLRAAGPRVPFSRLLRIRLGAEAVGLLLPSAGLVQEIVALRALFVGDHVRVGPGLASLAARRFALIHAHGIVLTLGTLLLLSSTAPIRSRGLCAVLGIAALALVSIGHVGPRWLAPTLADRARQSHRLPWPRLRQWTERHRDGFAQSGRTLARITRNSDVSARTTTACVLAFVSEALETFVILRLLGSPIGFLEVLSFDSAVGLVRALAIFVPAGLGIQEAGYAAFLLASGSSGGGLVASFVILKRLKESLYCALGLALLAGPRAHPEAAQHEPSHAGAFHLRLAQPDHPDA